VCGIAGLFSLDDRPLKPAHLKPMVDVLRHRGPDDAGYFAVNTETGRRGNFTDSTFKPRNAGPDVIDCAKGEKKLSGLRADLFLGHRRLAVIDLTSHAHQPMTDRTARRWLVYNGEIYNFRELREELKRAGHKFISTSDTEVVLASYREWGIDCVEKFNGMFAFALYDDVKKTLFLARDRFGVKPLYYTMTETGVFIFASEIKAILQYPDCTKAVNLDALSEYFSFQNLFQYHTLFKNITLLPAANVATVTKKDGFNRRCFWDYDVAARDESMTAEDAREETLRLFRQAVTRQLVADVPVGSYLSGGMDSGSITAVAAGAIPRLTTFTAGFELSSVRGVEASFDERADAELVANRFKTEHYEQVINAGDISWALPKVIWHLEDLRLGMNYPNYYISRLASKFVKVCLSGGGGDELYGGYPWRYYRVFRAIDREDYYREYYDFWQRLVADRDKPKLFADGVWDEIALKNNFEVFRRVFTFRPELRYDTPEDHVANSLYFELKTFLPGLFIIGDKLSMANSLEERFPFMDNDLVDFAMKIPIRHKLRNLEDMKRIDENELKKYKKFYREYDDGKNVLREAMCEIVPPEVTARKKQGFSAPDESWYRGENAAYVKEVLLDKGARYARFLSRDFVEKILREHSEQQVNHRLLIWSFLSFEW